jgi:hypothetical protein
LRVKNQYLLQDGGNTLGLSGKERLIKASEVEQREILSTGKTAQTIEGGSDRID